MNTSNPIRSYNPAALPARSGLHINRERSTKRLKRKTEELTAIYAAVTACQALAATLEAYKKAGFGNHVTNPIVSALSQVQYSLSEVRS